MATNLYFVGRLSMKTYAFCPRGHLHQLNITLPENPKSLGNMVWPPECLDYLIVQQHTVLVSQLRLIRVQDCPCPLLENRATDIGCYNPMPMIRVRVHDVDFLAHITNSAVDYISDALYNFLHSRNPKNAFRETEVDLPKCVDSAGRPVKVQRQVVIPFQVTTNRKTRKRAHLVNVIRVHDEINAVCVFGPQFLEKLDGAILTADQIQIGAPECKEYVPFVKHRFSGHRSNVISICPMEWWLTAGNFWRYRVQIELLLCLKRVPI